MSKGRKPVAVLDLGGTKFITAVIDGKGKMLCRQYCPTRREQGASKLTQRIISSIEDIISEAGLSPRDLSSIGIAAAAIVDVERGLITDAPNLPRWGKVSLRDTLQEHFGRTTYLINDASAAALGEHRAGAGIGLDNLLYFTISTGIGGGIIINGEMYDGTDGAAGEFGHTIILPGGPRCMCGKPGCLEALASGTAIARMARERIQAGQRSLILKLAGDDVDAVTAEIVARADRWGDRLACEVIDEAAHWLGMGLSNFVNLFNPQMIILGGGVSSMGERFFRPVRRAMKAYAWKLPGSTVKVVKSQIGADAGLVGVAFYCQDREG
jgi:glucokinase